MVSGLRHHLTAASRAACCIAALAGLAACTSESGDGSQSQRATGGASSGATTTASTPPAATTTQAAASTTPTASAGQTDLAAPIPTTPVIRDGKTPNPSVSAAPVPFSPGVRATYSDGVSLQVTGIKQGSVKANGDRVVAGPKTTFALRFVNRSAKPITLNQVVVSVTYGRRGEAARPVYDDRDPSLRDFSATVTPGKSTTASYAFSVPTDELSRVSLRIDFDAIHVAATFTGRARAR